MNAGSKICFRHDRVQQAAYDRLGTADRNTLHLELARRLEQHDKHAGLAAQQYLHAVDSLEPPYRSVFVLRDVEELSTEETAEALGLSITAVKSRLLRASLQLREKLTRYFKRKGDDAFAYL